MWYTDAVAWGSANGLVNGYGDGRFGPEDPITREQLAAFLYRYAMSQGEDVTVSGDLTAFTDGAEASGWAAEALAWAVGLGILNGSDGKWSAASCPAKETAFWTPQGPPPGRRRPRC